MWLQLFIWLKLIEKKILGLGTIMCVQMNGFTCAHELFVFPTSVAQNLVFTASIEAKWIAVIRNASFNARKLI